MSEQLFLGVMSGTSLDGLDLLLAEFSEKNDQYEYHIIATKTIAYNKEWKQKLKAAHQYNAEELLVFHNKYGQFIAAKCTDFISTLSLKKEVIICSHGHTVFHQPQNNLTFQLGNGVVVAAHTKCCVVSDFRSLDVALGGQGAPLVPVGDYYLFKAFPFCLNIGGIVNISIKKDGGIKAYDICPANMALNNLASTLGKEYDENGAVAAVGNFMPDLLEELNQLPFYKQNPPKSLGREWYEKVFEPILDSYKNTVTADLLATVCEHIAIQVAENINKQNFIGKCLITGGGAYNQFLISRLQKYTKVPLEIPDSQVVEFKEALIFAFLGYLRLNQKINCFSSVTGAERDSVLGSVYRPFLKKKLD